MHFEDKDSFCFFCRWSLNLTPCKSTESIPLGVPTDLQSGVKKGSTYLNWGFTIPLNFSRYQKRAKASYNTSGCLQNESIPNFFLSFTYFPTKIFYLMCEITKVVTPLFADGKLDTIGRSKDVF